MSDVSIRRKGNTYEARIRIGQKQLSRSGPTEALALERLEKLVWELTAMESPRLVAKTVRDYKRLYLQSTERRASSKKVTEAYLAQAKWALSGYFDKILDMEIEKVRKSDLQSIFDQINKSPQTIRHLRKHLRAVFKIAYDDEAIHRNPVDSVSIEPVEPPEIEVATPEQLRRIIEASRGYTCHPFVVLGSLLCAGPKEVGDSKPGWIRDGCILINGTKNKHRKRWLPLPERVAAELEGYKPPFKYERSNLRRRIGEACGRAGVKQFSPYVLRHSCATGMRKIGIPDYALDRFLGHAPQNTRARYVHDDALDYAHFAEDWCEYVFG